MRYWRDFKMATVRSISYNRVDIPVIFEQDHRLPLVSLQLVFRDSGALSGDKPGLAKLASRLMGEGTHTQGSEAFAEALESRAVSLNASVGDETFVISLHALQSEFSFGLSKLCALLSDPNFSDEIFAKIQTQMIGALTQKQSDFDFVADSLLKSLLFEGTAKAYPVSGTVESVGRMTLQDLEVFIQGHLGVANMIVVLGGDIGEDAVVGIVTDIARQLQAPDVSPITPITVLEKPRELIEQAATEQAYLYFGAPYAMPYDSDEVYLGKVASFVLGSSGFGSRLMEEVRVKRGLAYSAYARFDVAKSCSYFSGHLQTKLESAEEAKEVVTTVVASFVAKGMTQEELDAAKQFLVGSEPLRNETLQQRMGNAFHDYYSGKPQGYRREELVQIEAIELEQVNRFIASHSEIGRISFASITQ